MTKFGLLERQIDPQDYILGGSYPKGPVLVPDGQWHNWDVVNELQNKGTETMACTSFSGTSLLEIVMKFNTGVEYNFSDRFTAKMSGTSDKGNFFVNVANSLRHEGWIEEDLWPYVNTWGNYYRDIPEDLQEEATDELEYWDLNYWWVEELTPEGMMDSLQYSPLQVSAKYGKGEDGEVISPTGTPDHAMLCIGYKKGEYFDIKDTYNSGGFIKRYAWDYKFGSAMGYTLTAKEKQVIVEDNTLYQSVEGNGELAIGLDGELLIDEASKVLCSFIMRNDGDIIGKTKAVGLEDWNSVTHRNLKKEII